MTNSCKNCEYCKNCKDLYNILHCSGISTKIWLYIAIISFYAYNFFLS